MKLNKLIENLAKDLEAIGYTAEASNLRSVGTISKHSIEIIDPDLLDNDDDFEIDLDEHARFTETDLKLINDYSRELDSKDPDKANKLRRGILNTLHRRRVR